MKVETTLEKLLYHEFASSLKRVMSKWPEAKDIHCFVKIAEAIGAEEKAYQKTLEVWTSANGYELSNGEKTSNAQEITDHLLQKYGRFGADSKLTMAGSTEEEKDEFLEEKFKADTILKKQNKEITDLLEKKYELEIPRQIKVTDKHIKKEIISARDCYVLLPILDLSGVSDLKDESPSEED